MDLRIEQQKRCAVYIMDDVSQYETNPENIPCYLEHCSVVAELCIDGVIKVTSGGCSTLNQGSVSRGRYRGPVDAYL